MCQGFGGSINKIESVEYKDFRINVYEIIVSELSLDSIFIITTETNEVERIEYTTPYYFEINFIIENIKKQIDSY